MPSNHLILCHPLVLLPSDLLSIRVFSNESVLHIRWPKYWSFSFSISPSNEHRGLISFRIDWLDLFAVQGSLQSLLLHHSSKASICRHLVFFIVQLSHPYMTTGKTISYININKWQKNRILKVYVAFIGFSMTWLQFLSNSLEKTLMLSKSEGSRTRGWQRMRWLDGITDSMGMS